MRKIVPLAFGGDQFLNRKVFIAEAGGLLHRLEDRGLIILPLLVTVDYQNVIKTLASAIVIDSREDSLCRLRFAILIILKGGKGSLADTSISSCGAIQDIILSLPGHDLHQNGVFVL
jgi:hypothetical protein